MAQKEMQLLNSSHSPLGDGRRPMGQSPVASAGLVLVITGGHNHLALVQSPSPQHTPMRGTVLNKRETEAQRPAPRAPELQPHP